MSVRAVRWTLVAAGLWASPLAALGLSQQAQQTSVRAERPAGWLGLNIEVRNVFEGDRAISSQVLVEEVNPASGAAAAGLRAGDVLVGIGSQPANQQTLNEAVRRLRVGDRISLTVERAGQRHTFEVEAGLRPTEALGQESSVVVFTPPASRQATWSALRRAGSEVRRVQSEERRLRVSTPEGRSVQITVMPDPDGRAAWSYVRAGSEGEREFFFYNPDVEALVNGIDVLRLEIEELAKDSSQSSGPAVWRWLRGSRTGDQRAASRAVIAQAEARMRELEGELARTALSRIGPTPDSVLTLAVGATRPITPYAYLGRRYLAGAYLAPMNDGMREYFGVSRGALVLDAVEGAPALEAGLRPGDVVVAVDGRDIQDPDGLQTALSQSRPPYQLTVMRRGERVTIVLP